MTELENIETEVKNLIKQKIEENKIYKIRKHKKEITINTIHKKKDPHIVDVLLSYKHKKLQSEVILSEKFGINILSRYLRVNANKIKHIAATDKVNKIDFMYNDKSYDVKFSNPTAISPGKDLIWDFDIRGKKDYCDYFLLIGMINQRPNKVFLIPAKNVPLHHIRISILGESKWHKFKIWEFSNKD